MTLQPIAILFPDAESWAVSYLTTALTGRAETYASGVVVGVGVPSPRPARLVTVRRDGGPNKGMFDQPRLGVNVWAETEEDVIDLAELVSALLRIAPGDGTCTAMRQLSGASPVPDESAQPRRYSSFEATLRGSALT